MTERRTVARQLAEVVEVESALRAFFDDALSARRVLDKERIDRLDSLLHGPVARALRTLETLSGLEVEVLLDGMRQWPNVPRAVIN